MQVLFQIEKPSITPTLLANDDDRNTEMSDTDVVFTEDIVTL